MQSLRLQTSAFCAVDAHGEVKVNCWEAPTDFSKWKEEHVSHLIEKCNDMQIHLDIVILILLRTTNNRAQKLQL